MARQSSWGRRFGIRRPRVGQALAPPGGKRINPSDEMNTGPQDNVMDRRAYNGPVPPDRSYQIHQRMLGNGAAMSDADRMDLSNNVASAHRAAGNPVLTVQPKPMPAQQAAGAQMANGAPPSNGGMISGSQMNPNGMFQGGGGGAAMGGKSEPSDSDMAAGNQQFQQQFQQQLQQAGAAMANGNAGTNPVNPGAVMANPGQGGAGTQPVIPPTVQAPPGGPGSASPPTQPNPGASNQTPNTGPGGPGTATAKDPSIPSVTADGTNPPTQNPGENPTDYFARMKGWLDKYQSDHGGAPPGAPPPPITGGPDKGFMDQQKQFYDDALKSQGQANDAATSQAQQQFDLMTRRGQSKLQSVLAARGFGAAAASRGMQEITADAMNDFGKVQASIAQNNAQMHLQIAQNRDQAFQSAVGRVADAQIQTQLMGYKSYYDRLSFNDQAGLQLALKAGDMETAFQTLRMQQSFTGDQADLDRKWKSGEALSDRDLQKLMQNTEWANRFTSQKNEFNQQTGMQLSDQEFQAKRQEAQNKWQHNEKIGDQDFALLSMDKDWSYRNAAQTAQFNHETGQQLSQQDFANTQREAQNKFNHGETVDDRDWKSMMADKDFAHTVDMFGRQTQANLDIQDHAGYTQTLLTQGPAAAIEFAAREKESRGLPLSETEKKVLSGDKSALQSDREYQKQLGDQEWTRGLGMSLMQAYASTKDGASFIENLFGSKGFLGDLLGGELDEAGLADRLNSAGNQTANDKAYNTWVARESMRKDNSGKHVHGDLSRSAYEKYLAGGVK